MKKVIIVLTFCLIANFNSVYAWDFDNGIKDLQSSATSILSSGRSLISNQFSSINRLGGLLNSGLSGISSRLSGPLVSFSRFSQLSTPLTFSMGLTAGLYSSRLTGDLTQRVFDSGLRKAGQLTKIGSSFLKPGSLSGLTSLSNLKYVSAVTMPATLGAGIAGFAVKSNGYLNSLVSLYETKTQPRHIIDFARVLDKTTGYLDATAVKYSNALDTIQGMYDQHIGQSAVVKSFFQNYNAVSMGANNSYNTVLKDAVRKNIDLTRKF